MKKAFLGAGAVMILLLGLMSYLRDTVKSQEDVNRKLDTTLFGVLGHERAYRNLRARILRRRKKQLITEPTVGFGFAESIKKMRTKVIYQCEKEKQKVILVTSTAPQEGKTTVAANLALAIAQRGKKVLLIEGDLKKAVLADVLSTKIPDWAGLDKKKSKSGDLDEAVFRPEENLPLYLLANRSPWNKAAEFLGSTRFGQFLENWKQRVDYIIIDGPSVRGRADAEILMRQADLSLLVVRQNQQKIPAINDTIDLLESYGKRVAGCVLNHTISRGALFTSGYGYGYGYGYGGYRYGKRYGGYYGGYYYGSYYGASRKKKSSDSKKRKEHGHE
jgi:capsular exopolysaccharide synthesis family protein